jgi:hypothetical protein
MPLRVAEVEALATSSPGDAALQGVAGILKSLLDYDQLVGVHGESQVDRAAPIVRRNPSSR